MIGRVAAANAVPVAQCLPDLLKKLGEEGEDKPEPTKLSTQQRQELLLTALERDGGLDRLKDWLPELAKRAKALLLEFHHVFSLEPNEIGCTDATKHVIELMKDKLSRKGFAVLPHLWWMRYTSISRKCWTAVLSDPPSRPGAMLLCS